MTKRILFSLLGLATIIITLLFYQNFGERRYIFELLKYKFRGDYKVLNEIEKIYIINLDTYPDRLKKIENALNKLAIPPSYERFKAMNGKYINYVNLANGERISSLQVIESNKQLNGKFRIECPDSKLKDFYGEFNDAFIKNGVIGCFCSHREIWNDIIQKNYKKVLVLEDDVDFVSSAKEFLAISMENAPNNYDLLYLKVGTGVGSLSPVMNKSYRKIIKNIFSTEAYIITRKSAEILLANSSNFNKPVDHYMSDMIETGKLKGYVVWPMVIITNMLDTTMNLNR